MSKEEQLQKLYQKVKENWGALAEISRITGLHRNHVREVLQGKWQNTDVLEAAADVIQRREKRKKRAFDNVKKAIG